MQLNYAARILILLLKPSLGGMRSYMEQQRLLEKAVETICGIAMTLTDDASSVVSSQCLFIGMFIVLSSSDSLLFVQVLIHWSSWAMYTRF